MMTPRQGGCTRKVRGRNGRTRFAGICTVAKDLGVTRQHLYFVLVGERRSPRIESSEAFRQLVSTGGKQA